MPRPRSRVDQRDVRRLGVGRLAALPCSPRQTTRRSPPRSPSTTSNGSLRETTSQSASRSSAVAGRSATGGLTSGEWRRSDAHHSDGGAGEPPGDRWQRGADDARRARPRLARCVQSSRPAGRTHADPSDQRSTPRHQQRDGIGALAPRSIRTIAGSRAAGLSRRPVPASLLLRGPGIRPSATITMSVYFHATSEELAGAGADDVMVEAVGSSRPVVHVGTAGANLEPPRPPPRHHRTARLVPVSCGPSQSAGRGSIRLGD